MAVRLVGPHGVIDSYEGSDDAAVATAAAQAGAHVVRDLYGRRLNRIDKGAGDFATDADVEAEKTILGVTRARRPDDAVRQWLVDPLCGTLNYAVGTMLVAVDVALRDGAASVADPFSGEVFFTDGESARVRRDGADDAPLTPTPASSLVDVNLDPPFPSAPGFRAVDLPAHPEFVGRAAYATDGGDLSRSVHFAAGIALCRAAGCTVTGIDGAPIGAAGRGLVVAADAGTHGLLMSMTRGRGQEDSRTTSSVGSVNCCRGAPCWVMPVRMRAMARPSSSTG